MANRLSDALSPYLRQHADNPVDWWPWCDEAFAEARRRDVPILLSVGYAACHWCHVMAHESFEDEVVARSLERFVAIKVDREERPDVDSVYMQVTTALTGRGGWPMTVVLTPDATPVWAGTYLPKASFLQLLDQVVDVWSNRRAEVVASGDHIVAEIARVTSPSPSSPLPPHVLASAVERLGTTYDDRFGGFGSAPKFPPSMTLEWLLRHHARTGDPRAMEMAAGTCEAMARGGLYDQLAGGFARYSVDDQWIVPHFEKMLYDNALLLPVYLHWWRLTGAELGARVAVETADWLLDELRTPEGGFASALDADTDGVEGLTYVWTPQQLLDVLGDIDGARAAAVFDVTLQGTFEHGTSTLQHRPVTRAEDLEWESQVRERLLAHRRTRPQPARDDKVVASWNGLAITALADLGRDPDLGDSRYLEAAVACAELVVGLHVVEGRLRRTSRAGVVGTASGTADDYGNLAFGLLHLHAATLDDRWRTVAEELLEVAVEHFGAEDGSGFYDTADDAEALISRPRTQGDNAEPCGTSALAAALLLHGALVSRADRFAAAEAAIGSMGVIAQRDPRFAGWALAVAEQLAAGPVQISIAVPEGAALQSGAPQSGVATELCRTALRDPGAIVVAGPPDAVPALADRRPPEPSAYVCRGTVCGLPLTSAEELSSDLASA